MGSAQPARSGAPGERCPSNAKVTSVSAVSSSSLLKSSLRGSCTAGITLGASSRGGTRHASTTRRRLVLNSSTNRRPPSSIARPKGLLKRAEAPSTAPATVLPDTVVTRALAPTIIRMQWLSLSATRTLLLPSTAKACGKLKRAAAPKPSANPLCPARPATVVTRPSAVTTLQWLPTSPTIRWLSTSRAGPHSSLKRAAARCPSAKPFSPPQAS